jgi:predicted ATP-grasp superfamily ATP-dependent carboligase
MNVLVTSSRMPFALDEIRKLGRAGHRVFAADTFYAAPGSHSRYVTKHYEVTAPEVSPLGYVGEIEKLARRHAIDLIIPCFEEVFYLARHRDRLPARAHLFAADFELLARVHHKAAFHALVTELGIATPTTMLATNGDEMQAACARLTRYVARPVWSRGGVTVCANAGQLANLLTPADCNPTPTQPWIVQEYIEGIDLCSFSVAQHGRVVAHSTYVHPKEMEHSGGIVFESIVDDGVLACVRRIVAHTGYHGQISIDFRRGPRGLVVLECNPRPTAGVHLMENGALVDAIVNPPDNGVTVVPAGVRRLYASALVRDALLHPRELPSDIGYLFSDADDIFAEHGDRLPAVFQVLSYGHVLAYKHQHAHEKRRAGTMLMCAYFAGISWDGQPL